MNPKILSKELIELVGGKENIKEVTHCMTRLRFRLKQDDLIDIQRIKNHDSVIDVILKGSEYQIIIGPQVNKVYREAIILLEMSESTAISENLDEVASTLVTGVNETNKETKNGLISKLMDVISSIFVPLISYIAAGGILKGILAATVQFGFLTKESGTYITLSGLANVIFYFFPIFVGFTSGKKFGGNGYLSAILGAALVYPTLTTAATAGEDFTLFGIPLILVNYANTVLPILLASWIIVKVEKYLMKVLPSITQIIFVPLLSLIIVYPITLFIVGPIMTEVNNALSSSVLFIYDFSPVLVGTIMGGIWQIAVFSGIGWGLFPLFVGNITNLGYDPILGTLMAPAFAQAGAALGAALVTKNLKLKSVGYGAVFSGVFGVTEPAIYGINVPAKKPFLIACLSGAVGGMIAAIMQAKQYALGPSGVFLFPVFINPDHGIDIGFYGMIVSVVVSFTLAAILTYFFGWKNTILDQRIKS